MERFPFHAPLGLFSFFWEICFLAKLLHVFKPIHPPFKSDPQMLFFPKHLVELLLGGVNGMERSTNLRLGPPLKVGDWSILTFLKAILGQLLGSTRVRSATLLATIFHPVAGIEHPILSKATKPENSASYPVVLT